jgi:hypothetical protein
MLEQSLRKLFEQQADAEPPPGVITVASVLRQGRLRRRRRLIGAAGTPVLVAVAVAAIALTGALPSGTTGPSGPPVGYGGFAGGAFDPSYLSIKFGWLPKGTIVTGGETSPGAESLYAYAPRGAWNLEVYARDVCQANTAGRPFRCLPTVAGATVSILRRGPVIDGHESLWLHYSSPAPAGPPSLAWEYGPDSWAILGPAFGQGSADTALRIARAVEYGQHIPFRFASRFSSLPRGWRIVALHFFADQDGIGRLPAGVYLASAYKILKLRTVSPATQVNMNDDTSPDVPTLTVTPAIPGSQGCVPMGRKARRVTINGYRLTFSDLAQRVRHGHVWSDLNLCGAPVDGLSVDVDEMGVGAHPHLALSPAQLIQRMQLLGNNPANWVTNPLP